MNPILSTLLAQAAAASPAPLEVAPVDTGSVLQLVLQAGPVVKLVLLMLLVASIACWAIIFVKLIQVGRARRQSEHFLKAFWNSERIEDVYKNAERYAGSPLSEVFRSGYVELVKVTESRKEGSKSGRADSSLQSVDRAMRRAKRSEVTQLQKAIPFLATTGAA